MSIVFIKSKYLDELAKKYRATVLTLEQLKDYDFSSYVSIFCTGHNFAKLNRIIDGRNVHVTYFVHPLKTYERLDRVAKNATIVEVGKHLNAISKFPIHEVINPNEYYIRSFDKVYEEKNHRDNMLRLNEQLKQVWNKYYNNYNINSLSHLFYYQLTCKFAGSPFLRERESKDMTELIREQVRIHSKSKSNIDECAAELVAVIRDFEMAPNTETADAPSVTYEAELLTFRDKFEYQISVRDDMMKKLAKFYTGNNLALDAFVMLYRYQTLGMLGKDTMQLSLPDDYHKKLEDEGYNIECFASPINRHFAKIFTAFPDTDTCFGSLGSFFDNGKDILMSGDYSGSCDCPYQIHAIENCVDIIHDVLEHSKFKHKFSFALPLWKDADFYRKLRDSKFKITFEEIEQKDLQYKLHKVAGEDVPIFPCASLVSIQGN